MTEAYVKHNVIDGVSIIEFFHPQSNSLPGHILGKLAETIRMAGKDPNSNVILLKSGGG